MPSEILQLVVTSERNGASRARIMELATAELQRGGGSDSDPFSRVREVVKFVAQMAANGSLSSHFAATLCKDVFAVSTGSKFINALGNNASDAFPGPTSLQDPLLVPSLLCDALSLLDMQIQPLDASVDPQIQVLRKNLIEFVVALISLDFIPKILLLERLDYEFLEQIRMIANAKQVERKAIRINTNITYKQQKFNLLREESEGFSMLETYLASNLPPSFEMFWSTHHIDPASGQVLSHAQVEALHQSHKTARAASVLENITSLIGFFDLNPNKVLDLILDVFIANVVDHWDFFVELLQKSHWQPTRSTKTIIKPNGEESVVEIFSGSPVLGQILGFKFDFYNNVATTNVTPPQLVWITAILVKHKLVQLEDIYPHLSPADEDVDQELKAFKEKMDVLKKQGGKYKDNTLADAGALTGGDDGSSIRFTERDRDRDRDRTSGSKQAVVAQPTPSNAELVQPKPRRTNQKAVLASYLLALGAISHARLIIDRNPHLIQTHPDISDYMSRILHVVLEPVYSSIRPLASLSLSRNPELLPTQAPPMHTLNYKLAQSNVRLGRKVNHPKLQFFYPAWAADLPLCKTAEDAVKLLKVLLAYVSVSLDVVLASKVVRLGRSHVLSAPNDEKVRNSWLSIISKFLFPALSMTDQNPGLAHDIWTLVKLYPYDRRYALYGEWKHKTYGAIPQLGVAKAGCINDAKYTMRRLSKETVKRFGRYVGKIGHSNPTIAFHYILDLLQTYENQNATVVEGSKYMSELSFDVVTFTLIEQLATANKERAQAGGIGVRTWLKSLSYFTGSIFKKQPIELGGLLRYLYAQLVQGNTLDMIILQELVQQMCGIKAITDDVTTDQFNALAAGETLRREAFGNEPAALVRRVSQRLLKALVDVDLVLPFAVLIGGHIAQSVFVKDVGEIKILGWMLDNIRSTFTQYMDFVNTNVDKKAYSLMVPDIDVLRNDYNLAPEVAFAILRPKLEYLMKSPSENAMDVDRPNQIHSALLPTLTAVQTTLPPDVWAVMSPAFYVTFWSLTFYDIEFPKAKYVSEIAKLKTAINTLTADRSNTAPNTPAKRRKDIKKHKDTIDLLEKEMVVHEAHVSKVLETLKAESRHWFTSKSSTELNLLVTQILQHCVIPRCLFSPADALFSAKFMYLCQSMGVPNLLMLPFFDKMLTKNTLQSMIYLCTEMEARNFGRFLHQILSTLSSWFSSVATYNQACIGPNLPGFALRWTPDPETGQIPVKDLMQHDNFLKIFYKWQAFLFKTMSLCMESGDYAQITNSIIVLDKIQEFFPLLKEHAEALHKCVESVIAKETDRKDLKLMCTAYSGRLAKMALNLMTRAAFYNGGVEPPGSTPANLRAVASNAVPTNTGSDPQRRADRSDKRSDRDDNRNADRGGRILDRDTRDDSRGSRGNLTADRSTEKVNVVEKGNDSRTEPRERNRLPDRPDRLPRDIRDGSRADDRPRVDERSRHQSTTAESNGESRKDRDIRGRNDRDSASRNERDSGSRNDRDVGGRNERDVGSNRNERDTNSRGEDRPRDSNARADDRRDGGSRTESRTSDVGGRGDDRRVDSDSPRKSQSTASRTDSSPSKQREDDHGQRLRSDSDRSKSRDEDRGRRDRDDRRANDEKRGDEKKRIATKRRSKLKSHPLARKAVIRAVQKASRILMRSFHRHLLSLQFQLDWKIQ